MGGCSVLLSLALTILGVYWPPALWPVYGLWLVFFIMSIPWTNYVYNSDQKVFTEVQIPILQKYQVFFRHPHAASGISNAGAVMTMISFVACVTLLFFQRWIDAGLMGLIWFFLGDLRRRMHPTLMLREDKKRHLATGNSLKFIEAASELSAVVGVLDIVQPAVADHFTDPEDTDDMSTIMRSFQGLH